MGGGSAVKIAAVRLALLSPSNAFRPVAISYMTTPRAKMSVLVSVSFPSTCSGAMYSSVPRIMPSSVRLLVSVRAPGSPPAWPPAGPLGQGGQSLMLRPSKIQELRSRLRQHDVSRLEIAMYDALAMSLVQGRSDF